jgi:hypothetical protein
MAISNDIDQYTRDYERDNFGPFFTKMKPGDSSQSIDQGLESLSPEMEKFLALLPHFPPLLYLGIL